MKKLLAILISLCMVSAFAVPVFADANSDYIAAVKAYQARSPRRKPPTLQRWMLIPRMQRQRQTPTAPQF